MHRSQYLSHHLQRLSQIVLVGKLIPLNLPLRILIDMKLSVIFNGSCCLIPSNLLKQQQSVHQPYRQLQQLAQACFVIKHNTEALKFLSQSWIGFLFLPILENIKLNLILETISYFRHLPSQLLQVLMFQMLFLDICLTIFASIA